VLALVDPGDEVLVPDPGWPNYVSMVQLAGARPIPYLLPVTKRYAVDPTDLDGLVSPRTKAILINSPANPTGAVCDETALRDLIAWSPERDLYVISDEVYESFVYSGGHVPARLFDNDGRVVTVAGFSKTYAMTGWRLGYAIASAEVAGAISKLQEPLVSCAAGPTQKAAEAALRLPEDVIEAMRGSYRSRARLVEQILGPELLPVPPQGAFYGFVNLRSVGDDSYSLAQELLERERVATVPGESFGQRGRGMLRVAFTTDEASLAEGCRRIVRFATAGRAR
jgi:aspartate aminotransferase/aminotransferase